MAFPFKQSFNEKLRLIKKNLWDHDPEIILTELLRNATFNLHILLFAVFLTILGLPFRTRSSKYINFIKTKVQPFKFFKKIDRIYEEEIPDDETTLFTFHPHGVYCYGMLLNLNLYDHPKDKMSNMIGLGSRFILNFPLLGALLKLWGIQPINKNNLTRLMLNKNSLGMIPGGFEEATITTPNQLRIFINHRKGFIKYALKYGYTIRPAIILKEHQYFNTFDYLTKFRLFLNKIKMPAVIFGGRYGPFLPTDPEIITVIGKGIRSENKWEQVYEPSEEEIDIVHERYKEQILRIYEKHKELNGNVPIKLY